MSHDGRLGPDPLTLLFVLILQTSLQMNLNTLISDPRPITDGYFK